MISGLGTGDEIWAFSYLSLLWIGSNLPGTTGRLDDIHFATKYVHLSLVYATSRLVVWRYDLKKAQYLAAVV